MSLAAKAGNFTLTTSVEQQAVTGVGFQPDIVFFLLMPMTTTGLSVNFDMGIGVGISSTSRCVVTMNAENAQGTSDTHREWNNTLCGMINNAGTDTSNFEFDFVSMDADGFTIDVTDAPGAAYLVGYLALGGDDLTNVDFGTITSPVTTTGDQAYTGVGFQPDALMMINNSHTSAATSAAGVATTIGFASSASDMGYTAIISEDSAAAANSATQQRTDKVIAKYVPTDTTADEEASLSSFDADGFTLDWTTNSAPEEMYYYIALKGGQYHVGSVTSQTGTGTWSETGVGFTPVGGIFMSSCHAASGSAVDDMEFSLGFASGPTERIIMGGQDEDAADPTNTDRYVESTLAYINYGTSSTIDGSADLDSWDADGFTLDMVNADPSGNEILYFVMGNIQIIRASTVMAYIESLDSNIKASTVMAYVETLESTIKVSTAMAYIEVLVPLETVYTTKTGVYAEITGDDTIYASKVGAYVEHHTPWSSVPDDPTNLVAVVV